MAIRPIAPALCAAAAWGARWLVHGERVDERAGLALTAAVALGLALVLVGSVRTATRGFAGRGGGSLPRRCAGIFPPLALLLIGVTFARASLVDTSVMMEALVDSETTVPATLALGPGGTDVRLAGELTEGVADRLGAMLDANPTVTRIHLTSEGGLADEGQALGDLIAAHDLATFVPDYCISACTLAFARGRERLVMDDARVGFHAPYEPGLFGTLYRDDSGGQRAAYLAAGIAPDFVERALAVEPSDLWLPDRAQLLAARVATRIVDHDTLPDSNLDGAATPAGARALVLQNFPLLHALAVRRPAAMTTIAAWYLDGYRLGRPEGEDTRGLRAIVGGAVASALAHADDEVLRDLTRYLARALAVTAEASARARIADEGDLVEAAARLQPHDPDAMSEATALLDRALRGDKPSATQRQLAGGAIEASSRDGRSDAVAGRNDTPGGVAELRRRLRSSILRSVAALPRALPRG